MTRKSLAEVRAMLAQEFELKAEWREQKAAEFSEDGRNERAARGLRRLAGYVLGLPDDDPRLCAIDTAWQSGQPDPTSPDMILNNFGFGPGSSRGLPDQDEFFSRYAEEWSRQRDLENVYRQDPDRVRRLITADVSARDVVAVAHRRESLRKFRRLIDDSGFFDDQIPGGRGPEAVWQGFFEANQWILGGLFAGQALTSWDDKRLEQIVAGSSVAGVGKRTDALLRTAGRVRSMVLAEIKHHRTDLLGEEYRPGCWSPSKELSGGVAQVQGTVQRAVATIDYRLSDLASDGSEIPGEFTYIVRPRSFLIVGNLNEFIGQAGGINRYKYQSFELYRRHLQEPEIVTFDELLAGAEAMQAPVQP